MNRLTTTFFFLTFVFLGAFTASAGERPNIVWISLEDITPMMGCYGDTYARTPVFDGLAAGDRVVSHGTLIVRPGQQVSIAAVDDGSTTYDQLLRSLEDSNTP